jgi:hypothetical protein
MSPRKVVKRGRRTPASSGAGALVVGQDEVLELMAYLLASAELCTREPYHYGSFRLLDGASRLAGYAIGRGRAKDDAWLGALKREIDEHKGLLMWDREAYANYLHEATGKVADHIKRETPA